MKNRLYILVFSVFFTACTSNTIYKKPANLIPEKTMVDLLTDMELAVAAKGLKNKNKQRKIDYMPLVYEKYNIDSAQFQASNLYYTSKIDTYEKILKKVHANLTKQEKVLKTAQKEKDSLALIEKKKFKKDFKQKKQNLEEIHNINLFVDSEPIIKEGPESNIKYENYDWKYKQLDNCVYFFDNNKTAYRYGGKVLPKKTYTISAYIKMNDNSKPIIGLNPKTGNFGFIITGSLATKNISIISVGNNIYRCSASRVSNENKLQNNGIVSYASQSKKPFRVVGWQLEEGEKTNFK